MDEVAWHGEPLSTIPPLVTAVGGWIEAGEAATGAMRFLVRQLAAEPLAEIAPEDCVDDTQRRPIVRLRAAGERTIRWPRRAFWTWQAAPRRRGAAVVAGSEAPVAVARLRDRAPGRRRALWGPAPRGAGRGPRGRAPDPASTRHGSQHRSRLAGTVRGVWEDDPSLAL
jgi:hypothetical protein